LEIVNKGIAMTKIIGTLLWLLLAFGLAAAPRDKEYLLGYDSPEKWEEAIRKAHARNVAAYGESLLLVRPGTERISFGPPTAPPLTIQDVEVIAKRCKTVVAVAPVVKDRGAVAFGGRNWIASSILGTTPAYLAVRDRQKLKEGVVFSGEDVRDAKPVCLLGQSIATALFDRATPLGQEIKIKGKALRVVGVLAEKGCAATGEDEDDVILTPWTTAGKLIAATGHGKIVLIWAKAASAEKMAEAMREMADVLRQQRHIAKSQPDDFNIVDYVWFREELAVRVFEDRTGRKIPWGPRERK
jgi:putative ABC transport system permease protein